MIDEIMEKYITEGMGRKFPPLPAEIKDDERKWYRNNGVIARQMKKPRKAPSDQDQKAWLIGWDDAEMMIKKGWISEFD
jgi:hypothetical protein